LQLTLLKKIGGKQQNVIFSRRIGLHHSLLCFVCLHKTYLRMFCANIHKHVCLCSGDVGVQLRSNGSSKVRYLRLPPLGYCLRLGSRSLFSRAYAPHRHLPHCMCQRTSHRRKYFKTIIWHFRLIIYYCYKM